MKSKLLILAGNKIPEYRKEIYDNLAEKYDLTIVSSKSNTKIEQACHIYDDGFRVGKFTFQINAIKEYLKNSDAKVVIIGNFTFISNLILLAFGSKTRVISWGFWKTGKKIQDMVREKIIARGVKQIFYCDEHKQSYNAHYIKDNQAITARNTVFVDTSLVKKNFNTRRIIFVGSLNQRKGLIEFIEAFSKFFISENIYMTVIGEGVMRNKIEEIIKSKGLTEHIDMLGFINDKVKLAQLYSYASVEISPKQAGLSIQRAFGNSTPFITLKNAISGGEINSIIDGYNGYKSENMDDLVNYTIKLINNTDELIKFSINAKTTYENSLTIQHMLASFEHIIEQK